ncbi:Cytochrome P450 304a1 [Carabus blaptoides fortunei]
MWLSALLYLLVLVLVCVRFYKYCTYKPDNFPPGPIRLPLWGSYLFMLWENFNFPQMAVMKWAKKYGSVFGCYLADFPTVFVCDYETCKEVLNRPEFDGKPDIMNARLRTVGKQNLGIFFIDEKRWHEQRRFSLRHLRDYGFGRRFGTLETLMAEQLQSVVDFIKYPKYTGLDSDVLRPDGCILLVNLLYPAMMNNIMSVFGMEPAQPGTARYRNFRHVGEHVMKLQHGVFSIASLSLAPWFRHLAPDMTGYKSLMQSNSVLFPFIKSVIEEIRQARMSDDEVRNFFDRYDDQMKANQHDEHSTFSDDQLLMLTIDYMFPAVTAISSVVIQMIYLMFYHPHVLERMQKEIDDVVGHGRLPTLDDRQHLPYTEAVIKETLRKETFVPMGIPHRVLTDTTLRGYTIPKNTLLYTALIGAHMDTKVWGDPENFRPERFITPAGTLTKKDLSLPFGAGKRLCAGETFARNALFLTAAGLFQNFTFQLPAGARLPRMQDKIAGVTNTQKDMCWLRAVPRD